MWHSYAEKHRKQSHSHHGVYSISLSDAVSGFWAPVSETHSEQIVIEISNLVRFSNIPLKLGIPNTMNQVKKTTQGYWSSNAKSTLIFLIRTWILVDSLTSPDSGTSKPTNEWVWEPPEFFLLGFLHDNADILREFPSDAPNSRSR